jgi:hypothetical protein
MRLSPIGLGRTGAREANTPWTRPAASRAWGTSCSGLVRRRLVVEPGEQPDVAVGVEPEEGVDQLGPQDDPAGRLRAEPWPCTG